MKNFFRLAEGVMVLPLMEQLARRHDLWNADRARTAFENTPHADVDDILLRFGKLDGDDLEAIDLASMSVLRGAKTMALNVLNLVQGSRLGRVVITKLGPGKQILPHADVKGAYSAYYTRYHVVLLGLPGSMFYCGGEAVNMKTGDLWYFDANQEHSLTNNSRDDRIHMLVDVRIDP